jgi:hypothetical protein
MAAIPFGQQANTRDLSTRCTGEVIVRDDRRFIILRGYRIVSRIPNDTVRPRTGPHV